MTSDPRHTGDLVERIRRSLRPFDPVPAGVSPRMPRLPDIRAVVFDIYGTLMLSSAGDIGVHESGTRAAVFNNAATAAGFTKRKPAALFDRRWHELIREEHRKSRRRGIAYPEVEIRDIWKTMIGEGLLEQREARDADEAVEILAVEYELLSNRVTAEPTMNAALAELRGRGMIMGIISNAQFYTPLILETVAGQSMDELGLPAERCVWSFVEREGKPSQRLYEKMAGILARDGIEPRQVLYVGNDMQKDMLPAHRTGFRTALYAGDRRSLRMREDVEACRTLEPDAVITEIAQVTGLV